MSAKRCAVILVVVAVALGGCAKKAPRSQGSSRRSPTAGATSPAAFPGVSAASPSHISNVSCDVVTVAEVNAALGTAVAGRHVDISAPPATVCTYSGGTPPKVVIVRFVPGEDATGFALDRSDAEGGGPTTTAVSGYGDEAYTSVLPVPGASPVTTLVARKGDVEVLISAPTALGPIGVLMQKVLSQI
jgi:hypothetical protein